jgi:hypothetical protein
MSEKTKPVRKAAKRAARKPRRAKIKWYHDWVKMPIGLLLIGAACVGFAAYCVRFEPGTTLNTLGGITGGVGALCFVGAVGLGLWKVGDEIMLRRVSCPKCHARNKIPRRLTHYQCSACGKRSRV